MTNRSFPSNWTLATIGEASSYIQRGKSPKYSEASQLAVINQKCIRWNQLQTEHQKYIHPKQIPAWDANRHIRQGDILWNSTGTGTVGRAYLVKNADCQRPKVVDSHVTIVRPNLEVDSRIIFYWIKGPDVQNRIEELCDGSTNQVELSRAAISEIQIPLPPINEQRRIADKLDHVLARVDATNEHLSRVAPLIKRFRQSVLSAAMSGRLTADWRADKRSEPWNKAAIHEVAEVGTGSTPFKTNPAFYADKGTPWVTSSATQKDIVDSSEYYVTQDAIQAHRLKLYPPGTLLIAMYGEGKTRGQVTELAIHATINQACAAIRITSDKTHPKFVKLALKARYNEMRDMAEGGNQPNLNLQKVKNFAIPLPSLEEQTEIVRRVEKLFAFADRLEERLSQAQAAVQKLTPALLAKAFRGELVPQDPNDEPASELLKRLQESRTESAKPSRARKARTRKSP